MATDRPAGPTARRTVRRAVEILRARLGEPVPTAALAAACGVAERTLHKHFLAVLGVAPQVHAQRMRLAEARRLLLASGGAARVTDVGLRCGFAHLGRFALAYRARYGETPSGTLRHAADAEAPRVALHGTRPGLVVRPFSASGTRLARDLAVAATERIATTLQRHSMVVARVGPVEKAAAGGVRYQIEGSIQARGDRLHATVRLTDRSTGERLWGDSFEGDAAVASALLARLPEDVLHGVAAHVRDGATKRGPTSPSTPATRDLLSRCLPSIFATVPWLAAAALTPLDEAMEREPDDALVPALAGWCRAQLVLHHGTPQPERERLTAMSLADRAGALDGSPDVVVLTARACVANMAGEHARAEALVVRALARDPRHAWAWERRGYLHAYARNAVAALACFERALALYRSGESITNTMAGIGLAHTIADRHEEARRWMLAALAANPRATWIHRQLALTHALCGDRPAARASVEALRRAHPGISMTRLLSAFHHCPRPVRLMEQLRANGLPD